MTPQMRPLAFGCNNLSAVRRWRLSQARSGRGKLASRDRHPGNAFCWGEVSTRWGGSPSLANQLCSTNRGSLTGLGKRWSKFQRRSFGERFGVLPNWNGDTT